MPPGVAPRLSGGASSENPTDGPAVGSVDGPAVRRKRAREEHGGGAVSSSSSSSVSSSSSSTAVPAPPPSLRSFHFLRLQRRDAEGRNLTPLLLPTVLLLHAEDAEALRAEMGAVHQDVALLLARHGGRILPGLLRTAAAGPSAAAAAAAAAAAEEDGQLFFTGKVTTCEFSVRESARETCVMTFPSVGSTRRSAQLTLDGDSGDEGGVGAGRSLLAAAAAASSSSAFSSSAVPDSQWETPAKALLTVLVTHLERSKGRTLSALVANPGKLEHYHHRPAPVATAALSVAAEGRGDGDVDDTERFLAQRPASSGGGGRANVKAKPKKQTVLTGSWNAALGTWDGLATKKKDKDGGSGGGGGGGIGKGNKSET